MKNTVYAIFVIITLSINGFSQNSNITFYDIYITTPDSMNYIRVNAKMYLTGIDTQKNDTLHFELCKDFNGVYFDSLTVKTEETIIKITTINLNKISCNILDNIQIEDTISLGFEYCLFKTADFEQIPYSEFAMQANKDDVHINAAITRTDNWFPKLENKYSRRLPPFKLTIEVPLDYEVMASGKLHDVNIQEKYKYYVYLNYKTLSDRSLYFFINKNTRVDKIFDDGFKISLLVPDDTLPGAVDYLSGLVHSSYKQYEELYGSTNLNEYKLNAFSNNDMGYSGLYNSCNAPVWLFNKPINNNELYYPARDLIHEVSHTWWGNIVAPDASTDYWLFEGFAKFSEPQFLKTFLGDSIETLYRNRLKIMIAADADFLPPLRFISAEINDNSLKSAAAYYQGALFLYSLLELLGEEDFRNGIKEYVSKNWGKIVDSDDYFRAMQNNTDIDIHDFYYDYMDKPGLAEYSIREISYESKDSLFLHHIQIMNTGYKVLFSKYIKNSFFGNDTSYLFLSPGVVQEIEVLSDTIEPSDLIIIDPENIYLVKEKGIVSPGAKLYKDNTDAIMLFGVLPESPFDLAGMKNNMKIVSINGDKLADYTFEQLNSLLQQPEGQVLEIVCYDRNNQKQLVKVEY